jgi:hypothetical protein
MSIKNIVVAFTALVISSLNAVQANEELTPSSGGQFEQSGRYQVHYMALPSTLLESKIANTYGIKRSSYNAFVNIAILDTLIEGNPAVTGKLTGHATNLTGKITQLTFKEIKEGDAIYYIAQLPYRHKEQFTIQVRSVNRDGLNSHLKFTEQFYVD